MEKQVKSKGNENEIKEIKEERKLADIKYKVTELEQAAEALFKVKPECAKAAFLIAGIEEATKNEAQKIINEFMKKEVK